MGGKVAGYDVGRYSAHPAGDPFLCVAKECTAEVQVLMKITQAWTRGVHGWVIFVQVWTGEVRGWVIVVQGWMNFVQGWTEFV